MFNGTLNDGNRNSGFSIEHLIIGAKTPTIEHIHVVNSNNIEIVFKKDMRDSSYNIIYNSTVGDLQDLSGNFVQGFKIHKELKDDQKGHKLDVTFPYPVPVIPPIVVPPVIPPVVDPVQKKGSGGCSDCTPPTIGMDNKGKRLVDNGLVLNGKSLDVDYFKTHMPMQYTEIDKENHLQVKIYENQGPHNIKMIQFAMGLKEIGTPISKAQALLEMEVVNFANDVDNPSILETNLIDKDGIIRYYHVDLSLVPCMDGFTQKCLQIDLIWAYEKVTDNTVLAINGWDTKRNSFTDYFNDGLTVIDPNPVTIDDPVDKPTKECKISKVPSRNNSCQFLPMIQNEIERAMNYLKNY